MLDSFQTISNPYDTLRRIKKSRQAWIAWFLGILGFTGILGLWMIKKDPSPAYVFWIIYFIGAAAILYQPRYGLYLILGFSLAGDAVMMPWYPFNKGFSSYESIFFLSRSLIFSPLEVYIVLTLLSWLVRDTMQRRLKVYKGVLFWPAIIFLGFVIFGLVYGMLRGGNLNIALWEVRPLFYVVVMLILTGNLVEKRQHVSNLIWAAMLGLFIKAAVGNIDYFILLKGNLSGIESITEHAAPVQLNTVIVFTLSVWLYRSSWPKRLFLPLMLPVVLVTYLAAQRRAAMVSLIVALLLFAIILYKENRKAFWFIVPPAVCLFGVYVLAFWNSSSSLGLPAQAVKSVIAPGKLSARDQSSDIYRFVENFDLRFTMHQRPVTGIGFGQPFTVVIPLPDISWFVWWQYYPHNSIIWIWLNAGLGGFLAMLFLVGLAISEGVRLVWRLPRGELRAIALVATLYIVMQFLYAYVDISWDIESMLYIGVMLGLIGCLERVAARPLEFIPKRWKWQPEPAAEAIMESISGEK